MGSFKITKTVLKSLFRKPATIGYPAEPIEYAEGMRGHVEISADKCILCGICSKKCPTDAIEVSKADRMWTIHRMQCIQCAHCVEVCPKQCLCMEKGYTAPDTSKTIDTIAIPKEKE
jgi:Formate hydrogenlyase subunit 6/NADH:ubiquinone oxidoreductase 23 kD subunit (chain I)